MYNSLAWHIDVLEDRSETISLKQKDINAKLSETSIFDFFEPTVNNQEALLNAQRKREGDEELTEVERHLITTLRELAQLRRLEQIFFNALQRLLELSMVEARAGATERARQFLISQEQKERIREEEKTPTRAQLVIKRALKVATERDALYGYVFSGANQLTLNDLSILLFPEDIKTLDFQRFKIEEIKQQDSLDAAEQSGDLIDSLSMELREKTKSELLLLCTLVLSYSI